MNSSDNGSCYDLILNTILLLFCMMSYVKTIVFCVYDIIIPDVFSCPLCVMEDVGMYP